MVRYLYIFNPDVDICLGAGMREVTPSRPVLEFIHRNCLLPALYAPAGSAILVPAGDLGMMKFWDIAKNRGLELVRYSDLRSWDYIPRPWGWCHQIKRRLVKYGVAINNLPSDSRLDEIRELSHRRNTIRFYSLLKEAGLFTDMVIPSECSTLDDALEVICDLGGAFIKAPWSCSGRGVFRCGKIPDSRLLSRIGSIIRSQGSVMIEPVYEVERNFATEWTMSNGEARYEGLSVFETQGDGKYSGNILLPQSDLREIIMSETHHDLNRIILSQKKVLTEIIGEKYEGPLGVDMMLVKGGEIVPCVEVNMRMTMGRVAIEARKLIHAPMLYIF